MIPVYNPIPTPPSFDQDCRIPGNQWLQANQSSTYFPGHWRKFQPDLALAFGERCGWWAMRIEDGAVDHYRSKENFRHLTYDWDNYRYIAPTLNSSKGTLDDQVLDPFEVQDGWFEVLIPSMQLIQTPLVPLHLRAKAKFTLEKLHLEAGPKVRKNRLHWYEEYKRGLPMQFLEKYAPLVADAVKNRLMLNLPLP